MPLQQLFTSRKPYTATNYVARTGKLFYDEEVGYLRLGDGITPGGKVVGNLALASVSLIAPINPYEGELWYNPNTKELWSYYNGQFRGTINAATTSTIGGIKAGPGVVVASDGTLSLDSTGIPFNFGDFYAFTNTGLNDGACLSSINLDQDVNIISNGTGTVNVVGEFNVHDTDVDIETALSSTPIVTINGTGIIMSGGKTITGNVFGNVNATAITATNIIVGNTIRYDVTKNNGTATQLTSKSTTVVCNGRTGQITMSNSSIAKGEAITFTVTNSAVTAVTDIPIVAIQAGATANSYAISVTRVQVGSFNITLINNGTGPLTDTLIVNFVIVKIA